MVRLKICDGRRQALKAGAENGIAFWGLFSSK
jgi:hypothetical protein